LSPKPLAIAARVLALHGATTIPAVRNDPLEIAAPMSPGAWTYEASASTSFGVWLVS
jgi:hypothetical protein